MIFYFFNVGIYHNDKLTNHSFLDFLDKINDIANDRRKVVRKIDEKKLTIYPVIENANKNVRVVPFGKFRIDFKPYTGYISTSDYGKIKNKVIEFNTIYYNDKYKTVCFNYNQYTARLSDIEKYFNSFLLQEKDNMWEVRFEPIIVSKGTDRVQKSKQVKFVSLKLNLKNSTKNFIKNGVKNDYKLFQELFNKVEKDFDAETLTLQFGVGNKKKKTMDLENILYLLKILNIQTDYIETFDVKYQDSTSKALDTAKLKSTQVELSDSLNLKGNNPTFADLSEKIPSLFDKNKEKITISCNEYINDMIQITEEYNFFETPKDVNKLDKKDFDKIIEQNNVINLKEKII